MFGKNQPVRMLGDEYDDDDDDDNDDNDDNVIENAKVCGILNESDQGEIVCDYGNDDKMMMNENEETLSTASSMSNVGFKTLRGGSISFHFQRVLGIHF